MKTKYILYLLLPLLFMACKKKEGGFYETLSKGSYLNLVSISNTLDPTALTNKVTMEVTEYGEPVDFINLYVATSPTLDKTKWKLVKKIPYAGKTAITATVDDIAKALNIINPTVNIAPGTVYQLYNEVVTKDGRSFSIINTSSQDLEGQAAFNVAFRWQAVVVCPAFKLADHYDNVVYTVELDQWADFAIGDEVTIKLGPAADEVTLVDVFPTAFDHKDMVVKVNPANGIASVSKYTYGGYSSAGARYTAATTGAFNFLFPCTGIIDLTLNHVTTGNSNQGNFRLVLKKK
jgi:hypothetical protein